MDKAESPVIGEDETRRQTQKCCFCPIAIFPVGRAFVTSVQGQLPGLASASVAPWRSDGEAAEKEESCSSSVRVHGLQVFTLNGAEVVC